MKRESAALVIEGEYRWLKEFFDVQLQVTNLAAPGFTLTAGSAELTLPPGVSLAPTAVTQSSSPAGRNEIEP